LQILSYWRGSRAQIVCLLVQPVMIQIGHDMRKQSERDASTPRRKQRRKFRAKVAFNDGHNSLKQQKTRSVEAGFCPLRDK
jgi:hypothetical protein